MNLVADSAILAILNDGWTLFKDSEKDLIPLGKQALLLAYLLNFAQFIDQFRICLNKQQILRT